jgi:hypothetical protein
VPCFGCFFFLYKHFPVLLDYLCRAQIQKWRTELLRIVGRSTLKVPYKFEMDCRFERVVALNALKAQSVGS